MSMKPPSFLELLNLEGSLDRVSEAKFRAVAHLLEEVRDQPEVHAMLDRMRSRLRRVRPERKPNLQRLFYRPFEDLLVDEPTGAPDGRIVRDAAWLAWNYVLTQSDENERRILATMEARLRSITPGDTQAQAVMSRRLWPSTATLLDDALVLASTNKTVRFLLVGDEVEYLDDIRQLVRMLQVAEDIQLLKDTLPARPIRGLMNSQLALVRQTVALGHSGRPDRAYAIMLSVLMRMSLPAEFLRRTIHLNFDLPDTAKTMLYARLGRTVLIDLEKRALMINAMQAEELPRRVDLAQTLIDELSSASRVLRDSDMETRERLSRLGKIAEEVVSGLVETAWRQVSEAIKTGTSAPLEDLVRTEAAILALRKCAGFAGEVGLVEVVQDMISALVADLHEKVAIQFGHLNSSRSSPADLDRVEAEMYWSIRTLELTGRAAEAEQIRQDYLRRRAAV
ncbi:MAG TPA: hypothetical protein VM689_02755 [Aliidongia sp.]|nr:hypothetical protein [Aliidongia sp.]